MKYASLLSRRAIRALATCAILLMLSGCSLFKQKHIEYESVKPETFPVITAVGYAPVSSQPGANMEEKTLNAIKASKLDAYRELAEQVYGHKLEGSQTVASMIMQHSRLESSVEGVIKGAEVTKAYAVGNDVYATEMSLDLERVYDIYLNTARPQRVKSVKYY